MSYPINDVFESVSDLLMEHGQIELSIHNVDENSADIHIDYGEYKYHACYSDGVLCAISRVKKEVEHG